MRQLLVLPFVISSLAAITLVGCRRTDPPTPATTPSGAARERMKVTFGGRENARAPGAVRVEVVTTTFVEDSSLPGLPRLIDTAQAKASQAAPAEDADGWTATRLIGQTVAAGDSLACPLVLPLRSGEAGVRLKNHAASIVAIDRGLVALQCQVQLELAERGDGSVRCRFRVAPKGADVLAARCLLEMKLPSRESDGVVVSRTEMTMSRTGTGIRQVSPPDKPRAVDPRAGRARRERELCYGGAGPMSDAAARYVDEAYYDDPSREVCPGWVRPELVYSPQRATLNGRVLPTLPSRASDGLVEHEEIFAERVLARQRFKRVFPTRPFIARARFRTTTDTPALAVLSSIETLRRTAVGQLELSVEGVDERIALALAIPPPPPSPGSAPPGVESILFYEPRAEQDVMAIVAPGGRPRRVWTSAPGRGLRDLAKQGCGKGCPTHLVVRGRPTSLGAFLPVLRAVADLARAQKTQVSFSVVCDVDPSKERARFLEGPWHEYAPPEPCFHE